ncbi:FAD-containing oxidoreductase [Trinickia symbiotica]|uniref:FAD-containing oxidoreductase n=1 Tax=Trinickia symbiotica TaxID=863227 RepID=A0A2T3Y1S6_9BURK|nr:FAD-containing oxidoreductase [Trinickia symbiotica]PTB22734.1 FAD-containing oxidoreductase [Trinickia symbiotica]
MTTQFDAIIIGTGQAGPALAARLSSAGMQVAIVERNLFGGTCVNTGCIPTKALVASAYAAHLARRASDYGVTIGGAVEVDMKRVKARKDEISGRSRKGVERWLKGLARCTVIDGHARFESADTVRVNDELLTAKRIFINVGTRPFIPPMRGLDQVDYLTNSTMMDLDFLPEHLIVVGGSYTGLEFAQMYRRFGSAVTVVEKGARLISREDEDVSKAVEEILRNDGVGIETHAECMAAEKRGNGIAVNLDCKDGTREVVGSHLLLAVGRTPNTDDLGLERAGIEVNERGYITVDDQLNTSVPGVWALGDCNGRGAFTHTSYNDYEIVASNLLEGENRSVRDRIVAYGLYVDPPLGRAGMTENQVRDAGRNALVGIRPMTRVGRAVEKGETQGFMKVTVDADTKEILGAAILGVGGDEAIHCLLDAMYAKAPYTVVQRAVHIHPTVCELLPTLLGDLKPMSEAPADRSED